MLTALSRTTPLLRPRTAARTRFNTITPASWRGARTGTPPWRSTDRDDDGLIDEFAVFDTATDAQISSPVVPYVLGPEAELVEQAVHGAGTKPASSAGQEDRADRAEQPNRLLRWLDHEALILSDLCQRWSASWWRGPVWVNDFTRSGIITTTDAARRLRFDHE